MNIKMRNIKNDDVSIVGTDDGIEVRLDRGPGMGYYVLLESNDRGFAESFASGFRLAVRLVSEAGDGWDGKTTEVNVRRSDPENAEFALLDVYDDIVRASGGMAKEVHVSPSGEGERSHADKEGDGCSCWCGPVVHPGNANIILHKNSEGSTMLDLAQELGGKKVLN